MPQLTITWHTELDERVCPICKPLEGFTWTFDTKNDPFPTYLTHPTFGAVWDTNLDQSLTHYPTCRCRLTWEMIDLDLASTINLVKQQVKTLTLNLIGQTETWVGMGKVSVVRSQGRFVTWRQI